jgi:hypothetical protein
MSIATVAVFDTKADSRQVMDSESDDHPVRGLSHSRHGEHGKGQPPGKTVLEHRLGEDNAPMKVKIVVDPNGARASAHSGSETSSHPAGPTGHQSVRKHASGRREDSWTSSSS